MTNQRLRLILLGCLGGMVFIFIVVSFLGLSTLSKQSQKMVNLKLKREVLENQLTSLGTAKKQVQQYSNIKEVAADIIPNDKDQAQAVLQIFQLADQAGISIQSIAFPTSSLGLTSADATKAGPTSLISQATPVKGIKGLYSVQLTITPETGSQLPVSKQVTYLKMLDFLNKIEHNQRTAQIASVAVDPQNDGSSINFTLVLDIFIKP